ncbi:c-type cytochrome [Bdellovibrio reynosensis]|uniref:Cytochrome c domain-containing protein n=1 Tax=Bdellovibrio reynosensis TaxID=2835041 RepID=A0ABY4C9Z3_9BACT|nr:hypothetical protein [Bdellovibrio reynosensis]UOF01609.1 hypothetical protein MNR06_01410 [Bdellovibrio reynosensis]
MKKNLIVGGAMLVMVLAFQNCSDFALQDQVLYEQGLLESRESLDATTLPKLLESDDIGMWSKPSNPTFVNVTPFLARQWSVVVAADRSVTGKIISLDSGANLDEGYINIADGKIRAVHVSTATDSSYVEANVPTSGDKMVIAATFGVDAEDISLVVNGIVQSATVQKTGTPTDFSYVAKSLTTAPANGQVYEYVVYGGYDTGALTNPELNVMSRYIADNNTIANVVFDPSLIGGGTTKDEEEVNPLFVAAKAIIDAKCLSCHSSSSNGDFRNLTESKAMQNGLVVAGSPATSKLYYRLSGATVGPGPRNMPTSGSVSASEAQAISDWISSIQ